METKLKIVAETLPERCEVCHQADLFNPQTGYCERCKDTKLVAMKNNQMQQIPGFLTKHRPQTASTGKRFANLVLDQIFFQIISFLLLFLPLSLIGMVNPDLLKILTNPFSDLIISFALYFLYYFLFETFFQATPAKFLTGTKVIMIDGSKPDPATIAKRTFCRMVPFEVFSRSEGTWWHDRWVNTLVVDSRSKYKGS
jgi:uncharacterized RDD family membrane protein YckC